MTYYHAAIYGLSDWVDIWDVVWGVDNDDEFDVLLDADIKDLVNDLSTLLCCFLAKGLVSVVTETDDVICCNEDGNPWDELFIFCLNKNFLISVCVINSLIFDFKLISLSGDKLAVALNLFTNFSNFLGKVFICFAVSLASTFKIK